MVDGGPIDVLTGDYLAELTMLILAKAQAKDPGLGYARTFLTQVEEVLGPASSAASRSSPTRAGSTRPGSRRRSSALGLPRGSPTSRATTCAARSARSPRRSAASRCRPTPTSAAGASPRRSAAGADVVVTGRVTDASLVVGPGRLVARLGRRRLGRARGRGRRRARDRVRAAGHGRQLRVPRRDHRPALPGLPDRRGRRGRLVGDHQARRARAGSSRSARSPRSCSTRSPGPPTSARTSPRTSTPSRWRRTASTGSRSPGCGGARRPPR